MNCLESWGCHRATYRFTFVFSCFFPKTLPFLPLPAGSHESPVLHHAFQQAHRLWIAIVRTGLVQWRWVVQVEKHTRMNAISLQLHATSKVIILFYPFTWWFGKPIESCPKIQRRSFSHKQLDVASLSKRLNGSTTSKSLWAGHLTDDAGPMGGGPA